MKTKTINENYTGVCLYCGAIYKSQKSGRLFCPDTSHRQMKGKNGSRINPLIEDEHGDIINADHLLRRIYEDRIETNIDGWSCTYSAPYMRDHFAYTGPLPQGGEILVVRSYLIQRCVSNSTVKARFKVKPIHLLEPWEKANRQFVDAEEVLSELRINKKETRKEKHEE